MPAKLFIAGMARSYIVTTPPGNHRRHETIVCLHARGRTAGIAELFGELEDDGGSY